MALINNNYVLVTEESIDRTVDTTSHPTEQGLPISDTVRQQPIAINLSGKIVDTSTKTAETIVNKLKNLQKEGSLITYIGQAGTFNRLQIQSFNASYNHKNNGGADFSISLKEVRIAKKAYSKVKEPKVEEKPVSSPKVGDIVLFLGGNVYISSDATTPKAKKGKSKCKVTQISTLSNRKHIYHLISQDCKYGSSSYVYGWVDASCVSFVSKGLSKTSNSGGMQQLSERM